MISVAIPSFADNEFMSQTAVNIVNSSMLQSATQSNNVQPGVKNVPKKEWTWQRIKDEWNEAPTREKIGGVLTIIILLLFSKIWLEAVLLVGMIICAIIAWVFMGIGNIILGTLLGIVSVIKRTAIYLSKTS
jgi:hypothetical protein